MTTDVRVIHGREFLKATAQGVYDLEQSKAALLQIASVNLSPAGIDVLIDVRDAPSYLPLTDLWALAVEFARLQIGAGRRTAVLTSADRYENAHFFAISARNMGLSVQAFTSFEEAFEWMAPAVP